MSAKKHKKPGQTRCGQPVFKYRIKVLCNVDHMYELNVKNRNNLWREAMEKDCISISSQVF
jgi:hypothetical protein